MRNLNSRPKIKVNFSTLIHQLDDCIRQLSNPDYLLDNVNIYTEAITRLRSHFLEPLLNHLIANHTDVNKAIQKRKKNNRKFRLNMTQKIYVVLNIKENSTELVRWIAYLDSNKIPDEAFKINTLLYKTVTFLNRVTHDGDSAYTRQEFAFCFFGIYQIYKATFPKEKILIEFRDEFEVDEYIVQSFRQQQDNKVFVQENETILAKQESFLKQKLDLINLKRQTYEQQKVEEKKEGEIKKEKPKAEKKKPAEERSEIKILGKIELPLKYRKKKPLASSDSSVDELKHQYKKGYVARTYKIVEVANELSISRHTIVEFLAEEGITVDDKPTSKLTEEAYELLLEEFQEDKLIKEESKRIGINKFRSEETGASENEVKEKPKDD